MAIRSRSQHEQPRHRPVDRSRRSRRDPSDRRTAKPDVTLEQTSQTAVYRTCMDTLTECVSYCVSEGGRHVEPEHLNCMLDAWDLLSATSTLTARGSHHAEGLKDLCAEAVKACEESCEGFEDDETMAACADVCREAYEHLTS
jgi:hypothetical protein